jgi:hypothetical protein
MKSKRNTPRSQASKRSSEPPKQKGRVLTIPEEEEEEKVFLRPSWYTERRMEDFKEGFKQGRSLHKRPGPKPKLSAALISELQWELMLQLLGPKPKKQGICVEFVLGRMKAKGHKPPQDEGHKIEREIVRPVYKQLGWSRSRT